MIFTPPLSGTDDWIRDRKARDAAFSALSRIALAAHGAVDAVEEGQEEEDCD